MRTRPAALHRPAKRAGAASAAPAPPHDAVPSPESHALAREDMVSQQLVARGIADQRVLRAMSQVPRHAFVPASLRELGYADRPLPIGHEQTISQPYIVAFMTEALRPEPTDRVLEIGTGSGYQAAVLAELVAQVYTVEIVKPLGERASEDLARLGYRNVHVRMGDGFEGWPEQAPFDAVIVTCSPERVPQPLLEQLKDGGRMIIPVGSQVHGQELHVLEKHGARIEPRTVLSVRFVPMMGKAQGPEVALKSR